MIVLINIGVLLLSLVGIYAIIGFLALVFRGVMVMDDKFGVGVSGVCLLLFFLLMIVSFKFITVYLIYMETLTHK